MKLLRFISLIAITSLTISPTFAQRGGHGGGGGARSGGGAGARSGGGAGFRGGGGFSGGGSTFRGSTGFRSGGFSNNGFRGSGFANRGFTNGFRSGGFTNRGFRNGFPRYSVNFGYWGHPYYGFASYPYLYGYAGYPYGNYDPYYSDPYYDNYGAGYISQPYYGTQAPANPVVTNPSYEPDRGAPAEIRTPPQPGSFYRAPDFYLIAFTDHTIQAALSFTVEGDSIRYTTREHVERVAPLSSVDVRFSEQINRDRHVEFRLP